MAKAVQERFWEKVQYSPGCWEWTASRNVRWGYGQFKMDGKPRRAHRVAYELLVGPIPEGLVLDHLCRVRHCVNPDHLEPVTKRENERRGKCGELFVRVRTCLRGHELSASNVYMWGNPPRRYCRKCYLTRKKRK